ncbi:MAG: hypothetical protein ABSE16_07490 [Verrucomicrobiota bacterium]|jgi:hypothetical protein
MKIIRAIVAAVCTLVLCSCKTETPVHPPLATEASFNEDAGLGRHLFVTLSLESGDKLLFVVDTGSPCTILDKSLEPKLGKCLRTRVIHFGFCAKNGARVYNAPKLYCGHAELVTDDHILTCDLGTIFPDHSVMGILGMDCLKHYCIQLDSAARRMVFLGRNEPTNRNLGRPYPLHMFFGGVWVQGSFFDVNSSGFRLDTGYPTDGALKPRLFLQVLAKNKAVPTTPSQSPKGPAPYGVQFPKLVFGGQAYHYLMLDDNKMLHNNIIGLRFLMRNFVTLDFPNRMMYLQPRTEHSIDDSNPTNAPKTNP